MLGDRIILVCTVVFACVYLYATAQIPSLEIGDPLGPKAFPRLLAVGLFVCAGLLLLEILRERKAAKAESEKAAPPEDRRHYFVIVAVTVWTALYYAVFERVGFILDTAAFILGLTAYFNRGKWVANTLVAVLFSVGAYVLFVKVLGVTLAPGVFNF
jgi:putative tricarboxylic transport membrane protein